MVLGQWYFFVGFLWTLGQWHETNLKEKTKGNTSRKKPGSDTTWWELGPIFREVEVNSIGGVCDVGDPASNQHDSKSSNRYTTAPLVINQAQLDWLRREGFSCKRIEEH